MSAAANAAGYLYVHGQLPASDFNAQVEAKRSPHAAKSQSTRRLEPKTVLSQGQPEPLKQARTPRIEYRKRRFYPLPSATPA
jgi:hypothetical protein